MTWLLLFAVFACNIYRAATQSITVDEVTTYQRFVAPPWSQIFTSYSPNHHVLYSVLAKLTTGLLGVSELTLRLPSLLGGLIYLLAARAIVLYVFTAEWAVVAFGLLSLNPFILDYLSVARGYGLALGLLISALWFLMRSSWFAGGICLGLTLGANLSFFYPVAGLCAATALASGRKELGRLVDLVFVPAAIVAFVIVAVPLSRAVPTEFSFGSPDVAESIDNFIILSLKQKLPPFDVLVGRAAATLGILTLVCGAPAWIAIMRQKSRTPLDSMILLNGGAMLVGCGLSWLAHVTIGVPYPLARTGVYWPVMLSLGGVALIVRFARRRELQWPALSLAALCLLQFGREFEVSYYEGWRYNAGIKRIAGMILQQSGRGKLRIVCSLGVQDSLRFYRDRNGAEWEVIPDPKASGTLYVFLPEDLSPAMKPLYRDPVSEAVLAQ